MGDETAEDEEKVLDVKADAWAKRQRLRIRKHPRSIDAMQCFPSYSTHSGGIGGSALVSTLEGVQVCNLLIFFFIFTTLSPIRLSVQ